MKGSRGIAGISSHWLSASPESSSECSPSATRDTVLPGLTHRWVASLAPMEALASAYHSLMRSLAFTAEFPAVSGQSSISFSFGE